MQKLVSVNPADLSVSGEIDVTDPEEIPKIIEEIRIKQEQWSRTSVKERLDLLKNLRMLFTEATERIARTVHDDTGKPRVECYSTEILSCMGMIKFCESTLKNFRFKVPVNQGPMNLMCKVLGRKSYIDYRPLGVVGVISSYNFPLAIPFTEAVMAVSAGNGVILKTSSDTPLTGTLIQQVFEEAGFPKGLVRSVAGPGTGSAITSARVDKIVFTGGTETGRDVMSSASENLTPVILELGGKDAMIVCDDADIDRTVEGATWCSFVNSGQVCVSVKRIYVQEKIYDTFIDKFLSSVKSLKQGNGWDDPDISVGPMINEKELNRMISICEEIESQGGRFLTGGKRNDRLSGYYFEPTIVVDLDNSAPIVKKEIFGPIVCIFKFKTDDEAVELANSTDFALGGSVWTRNIKRGENIARRMYPGTVDVNNAVYTFGLPATPWGGRWGSGLGVTHGEEGFRQMMYGHHVHIDKGKRGNDIWWMPYDKESSSLLKDLSRSFFGDGKNMISTGLRFIKYKK